MACPQPETSFHDSYGEFLRHQKLFLEELLSASNNPQNSNLQPLVDRLINHYEQYYKSKSKWAKLHILSMFSPSWTSSLEDAFLWIGGWRPSIAFHLLYSAAGLQLDAQFQDIISGIATGDLGDLSPSQLSSIDAFQRLVIRDERNVTEEMATHQETVADSSMVELSKAVSQMKAAELSVEEAESIEKKVESTLAPKEKGLVGILQKADDLRIETLKGIVERLNPLQGVHFLIAVAQLHLRFHEWGVKKDAPLT